MIWLLMLKIIHLLEATIFRPTTKVVLNKRETPSGPN